MSGQCEAVLLTAVQWGQRGRTNQTEWLRVKCWAQLRCAYLYGMNKVEQRFMGIIVADQGILQREELKSERQNWDRTLVIEFFAAALQRNIAFVQASIGEPLLL